MEKNNMIITALVSLLLVITIVMGTSISENKIVRSESPSPNRAQARSNEIKTTDKASPQDKKLDNVDSSNTSTNSNTGSTTGSNSGQAESKYKDGEYTGSGPGYHGPVKVSVKIEGGKIRDISILENTDDAEYFDRAKSLINDILNKQSTDVSVVSGATYSSNGIIGAVNSALASGGN